jgi:hypothetical protein
MDAGDAYEVAVELLDAGDALSFDGENRERNECTKLLKFPMMVFWRMLFKNWNARLCKVD